MRTKHKWAFECPTTGRIDTAPWTPQQAAENGRIAYKDHAGCEICGRNFPKMRYVTTNECVGCVTAQLHETFNLWCQGMPGRPDVFPTSNESARAMGVDWHYNHPHHPLVCSGGDHLRRTSMQNGTCVECELLKSQQRAITRGPRAAARRAGMSTYMPNEACAECGTTSARIVVTNACTGCRERPKSPRAIARAAGHRMYTPTESCPGCGQHAERNVVTNACSGCTRPLGRPPGPPKPAAAPKVDGRRTPTSIMVEMMPDMIISRDEARANGFTQYRTGKPCQRGHTGWRYVSVGTCIPCARGVK